MVERFTGELMGFYSRDEVTGESLFGVATDEIDVERNWEGYVCCRGTIPKWPPEITLLVSGHWSGSVFLAESAKPVTETKEASKKILQKIVSGLKEEDKSFKLSAKGIHSILEVAGIDLFQFAKEPDALERLERSLPKIRKETLEKVYGKLRDINLSDDLLETVSRYGGTVSNCSKLIQLYGANALKRLKRDPYKAGFFAGMDFYTCDRIAFSFRKDPISRERMEAIIYEALEQEMSASGSTYVTQSVLKKRIRRVNRKSAYAAEEIPDAEVAAAIRSMRGITVELVTNSARIYRKSLYEGERVIAENLKRLNRKVEQEEYRESYVADVEKLLGITYSERQREAFHALGTTGVKLITGGPGTGKTTVINGILYLYRHLYPEKKISLCAPTGRAAQRMSEVTGMEAQTIHRMIEYVPYSGKNMARRNAYNPLDADMVVVDEMSMVDTEIFSMLLPAVKDGATLILIGDEDQLQSVSPGNVLHDLIESGEFEAYRLKEVFRQKSGNTIIDNAYKILKGEMDFVGDETFEVCGCGTLEEARTELSKRIEQEKEEQSDVQILSPVKVGECGTIKINLDISEELYRDKDVPCFRCCKTNYHAGENVIFRRNNYDKSYFNGDIGRITAIHDSGITVEVNGEAVELDSESMKDVSLAYAVTIHKSQGSEYGTVILVLPDTYTNMLNRNILFTAVTRAKNKVVIIYVNSALYDAVHTVKADTRNTGLCEKMNGIRRKVLFARPCL